MHLVHIVVACEINVVYLFIDVFSYVGLFGDSAAVQ